MLSALERCLQSSTQRWSESLKQVLTVVCTVGGSCLVSTAANSVADGSAKPRTAEPRVTAEISAISATMHRHITEKESTGTVRPGSEGD